MTATGVPPTARDELGDLLREVAEEHPPEHVHEAAAELLRRPLDWPRLIAARLRAIPEEELRRQYAFGHVPNVEPVNIPLWSDPDNRAAAVIGHFDRERFDAWLRTGHITAHHHRWSFASRMIRGQYMHWWYDNTGTAEEPSLELGRQEIHRVGDVFTIDHARYHCVLAPAHDTVTLVIRGGWHAPRRAVSLTPVDERELERRRRHVVSLLDAAGG